MVEFSSTMVREEAKFIPATLKHIQHFEHVQNSQLTEKISANWLFVKGTVKGHSFYILGLRYLFVITFS